MEHKQASSMPSHVHRFNIIILFAIAAAAAAGAAAALVDDVSSIASTIDQLGSTTTPSHSVHLLDDDQVHHLFHRLNSKVDPNR
jgi:hypothetical protein